MARFGWVVAAALAVAPLAGQAQPARNANVYNGTAHQPTGGDGSVSGKAVQDLNAMNAPLQQKAQQSAGAPEVGTNVYGVQPGGVVQITPTDGHAGAGVSK